MRKLFTIHYTLFVSMAFLLMACTETVSDARQEAAQPWIYPDYVGVTVPVNISGMMGYYYDSNRLSFTDGSEFYISGIAVTGDVNRDGLISVSDVTALIAALLRGQQANTNTFSSEAADCNHDNQIGINDVTALINYLLSHSW